MAVDDKHKDYTANLGRWQLVDDICDARNLKAYINDLSIMEEKGKQDEFKDRASFLDATGFTESGLVGIAFEDEPVVELPSVLEYLMDNTDGTGVNLANHLLSSLSHVLRKGRVGLFVTYPQVLGDTSRADQMSGEAVATIHTISAQRIINWWTVQSGSRTHLGGVVFKDTLSEREGFDVEEKDILRTLTLEGGICVDRKWQKTRNESEWEVIPGSQFNPLMGNGGNWTEIPFVFCGAMDNTTHVDKAPLFSLARKNADHLNNSAINEEGIWFSGHIQPVADEMDANAYEALLNSQGTGFKIGSGQLVIAKGFKFEVADPNTAARQGMLDKVEEMKSIGARILQPGGVAKTAQQDAGEQRVQHSVLSLAVTNLEDAYDMCLRWAALYMNADEPEITLPLTFMEPEINAEMIDRIIALFDRGLVGPNEVHSVLTRVKIVDGEKTAEQYSGEVNERGGTEPPVNADA